MRRCLAFLVLLAATSSAGADERERESRDRPVPFDRRWMDPYFQTGPLRDAASRSAVGDFAGATTGFQQALALLPHTSPEHAPATFMLALARMNAGQWQEAGTLFEGLYERYPLLAPYHAYYAARCRVRRGDTAGAIEWAAKVPARSVPEAEATLVKIDALVALARWSEVEGETARFLDRFPAGPRRAEASFRRALALEALGRPAEEAIAIYKRIWAEAPLETWAKKAEERLLTLAAAHPGAEGEAIKAHTPAELIARGMALFDKNQNAEAEAMFGAALAAANLTPADACRAQFHRAQSVFKQRQRPRAAPVFALAEAACRTAADTDLVVKALYQGARCLAAAGDRPAALAKYDAIENQFPAHSYADDARLRAAEVATDAGDEAAAETLLGGIAEKYPSGDLLGEALWRLAFRAIRANDWAEAHRRLDENLRKIAHEDLWYAEGRALYWKARVFDKQARPSDARAFYTRAVREYPLSVYALMSLERMRQANPRERAALVAELRAGLISSPGNAKDDGFHFSPRPVFGEPGFLRAVELARLGIGTDARRELAKLGFSSPDSRDAARKAGAVPSAREDVLWITAILLDRGRSWTYSHMIPRQLLTGWRASYPAGRGAAEWRLAYPRAFPEMVAHESRANHVPEALQYAIMREESTFNPAIESFANAIGLTQLVVKTAQRFSPAPVTRETLLDPGKNLQIGSRFLGFLLEHFGSQAGLSISGYNAGESAVDRWLRERGTWELDEFIEAIPYDETRNYTKRVLASYAAYSWLYDRAQPVPALSFSLRREVTATPAPAPKAVGRPPVRRRR